MDIGWGGGGESEIGAARRAASPFPEAIRKTLQREKSETTEEKEAVTGDGEGMVGDLTGYVPTG